MPLFFLRLVMLSPFLATVALSLQLFWQQESCPLARAAELVPQSAAGAAAQWARTAALVSGVLSGGYVNDAEVRRHWAGAGDFVTTRPHDERQRLGR